MTPRNKDPYGKIKRVAENRNKGGLFFIGVYQIQVLDEERERERENLQLVRGTEEIKGLRNKV